MSWQVVEAKWDGFRQAFADFDPQAVAAFDGDDVERLAEDTRIIRNRRKIEATVHNAEVMLALDGEAGGFTGWLRARGDPSTTPSPPCAASSASSGTWARTTSCTWSGSRCRRTKSGWRHIRASRDRGAQPDSPERHP